MPFSPANRALNQAAARPLPAHSQNHRQNIADFLNHITKCEILRMIWATRGRWSATKKNPANNAHSVVCDYWRILVQC